jgi:hypothetical protein
MTTNKNRNVRKERHCADAQERIMASEDWVSEGLAFCRVLERPWPEWEQRLLAHIAKGNTSEITEGVQYACDVLERPWPDLEPPLLDWLCAGGQVFADEDALWAFTTYLTSLGESETLEDEILRKRLSEPAIFYASRVIDGRWREAEQMILDADTPDHEGVLYGYEDDSDVIENQITVYARDLIKGRWQEFEERVRRRTCNPNTVVSYTSEIIGSRWEAGEKCLLHSPNTDHTRGALVSYARDVLQGRWENAENILSTSTASMRMYADEVIKGRLPETLHNRMLLSPSDEYVEAYFEKYGQQ